MSGEDIAYTGKETEEELLARVDTSIPYSARIWNYWMGGTDFYPVDRQAGDQVAAMYPSMFLMARVCRYFIARVVHYLAAEAGIRQFLDVGTGLPSHDNTHEVAQRVAPDSRVVYVDKDPLVLANAAALRSRSPDRLDYIAGDLYDPAGILELARTKLDFDRPVALMIMGVLGHIPMTEDDRLVRSIVSHLVSGLPSGSHLAIYDNTNTDPGFVDAVGHYNEGDSVPYHPRSPDQILRLFDGLELVDPGMVPVHRWRPDPSGASPEVAGWGGVAMKP